MKVFALLLVIFAVLAATYAEKDPVCGLEHSLGGAGGMACRAYMPSWTYKAETKECIKFVYGGCRGNENRFETKDECEEKCLE